MVRSITEDNQSTSPVPRPYGLILSVGLLHSSLSNCDILVRSSHVWPLWWLLWTRVHLMTFQPTYCRKPPNLLTVLQVCQAHSHIRDFVLALPSFWNAPLPTLCMVAPSLHLNLCSNFTLFLKKKKPSLTIPTTLIFPSSTLFSLSTFVFLIMPIIIWPILIFRSTLPLEIRSLTLGTLFSLLLYHLCLEQSVVVECIFHEWMKRWKPNFPRFGILN